jgi:TRAP-type C4-dicarboxylate transport system substrate-binding protein
MEQGAALRNGVVDLSNTTTSFVAGVSPESLALNYATVPWAEMRRAGTVDYLNTLMMEKGLYYYARTGDGVPYHIYLNKKIEKADLTGLKIRIAPIYREFFTKLGASVMQIPPGEVFTALDRGVVDGYGWPLLGIFDLGWHEKTKYRVDPGFYNIELGVIFSAKSWNALTPAQRDFLNKQAVWLESLNVDMAAKDAPVDIKRQADAGIQVIKLDAAEAKRMVTLSQESGWAGVLATSPQHGAKLRQLMAP